MAAFHMAESLCLLILICLLGVAGAEGFFRDLAKNVARNALAGGLAAATGALPLAPTPSIMSPPAVQRVEQGNESNSLANSAATKLESVSKGLKNALETNPFFKLAGLSMEIRELADANPEALKGGGIYIVSAPQSEEDQDPKTKAVAQGVLDIALGIDSPAANLERKHQKDAENEFSSMMSSQNQEDLERTMSPQERMSYDQQRIAQIRHDIRIQRKTVERARALIAYAGTDDEIEKLLLHVKFDQQENSEKGAMKRKTSPSVTAATRAMPLQAGSSPWPLPRQREFSGAACYSEASEAADCKANLPADPTNTHPRKKHVYVLFRLFQSNSSAVHRHGRPQFTFLGSKHMIKC